MGLFRKTMSISTFGVVPYRDKQERATRYAKQTRNAARAQVAQNAAILDAQRKAVTALDHANVREDVRDISSGQLPPAGWYQDPQNAANVRWFDGIKWTEHVQGQGRLPG